MRSRGPKRLGELAEASLWLRIDCRTCGRWRLLRPQDLYRRNGPSFPWEWLRFRCRCGSVDSLIRVGSPEGLRLEEGFEPIYRRDDLVSLVAGVIGAQLPYLSEREARTIASAVLRRCTTAGIQIVGRYTPEHS